jgi:hypothetical protein
VTRRARRSGGAWQTSASDPSQTAAAGKLERRRRDDELEELRQVLEIPAARRFLWRALNFCGVHSSVYPDLAVGQTDGALRLAYAAGRQDVGHWLEAEIALAADEVLLLMMREAKDRDREAAEEAVAQRTPSATKGDTPDQET